jgi:GTP-binding protein
VAAARVESEFLLSAAAPEHFPKSALPEAAFIGRSNVGKSTLINRLVGRDGLAFTSSRPGCTQLINFYRVEGHFHLVDLPGYGYAQVPVAHKDAWRRLIDAYLESRETLRLCVLLLDARRGWMEKDLLMREWLDEHGRPYLVVATKVDKLNQKEFNRGLAAIRKEMRQGEPVPYSAEDGRGVREIWQTISKAMSRA